MSSAESARATCRHCGKRVERAPRCTVVNRLLCSARGASDNASSCSYGCGFVVDDATHVCARPRQNAQVRVAGVVHASFAAYVESAKEVEGVGAFIERGLVYKIHVRHATGVPTSLEVLNATREIVLAKVTWSSPATGVVVQHALLHNTGVVRRRAKLWPAEDPASTFDARVLAVEDVPLPWADHVARAVAESTCARRRWWSVFGEIPHGPADKRATALAPRMLLGCTGARAAYVKAGEGVRCAFCNVQHRSFAAFVGRCAPEASSLCA